MRACWYILTKAQTQDASLHIGVDIRGHMHGTMINEPNDISTQLYFGIYKRSPIVILADRVLIKCRITRALDRTGRSWQTANQIVHSTLIIPWTKHYGVSFANMLLETRYTNTTVSIAINAILMGRQQRNLSSP